MISNPVDGTIEVRDETGEIILRKTNLSQRQVENVEKRFKRLGMKRIMHRSSMSAEDFFDPMIS